MAYSSLPPLKFHLVNAFASTPQTSGNQAAVVLLPKDDPRASDETYLKALANDFNYADSAFVTPINPDAAIPEYYVRWFTPTVEVPLCGHATLATSFVMFNYVHPRAKTLHFQTRYSGQLVATLEEAGQGGQAGIDLPMAPTALGAPESEAYGAIMADALGFCADDIIQVATYDLGGPSALAHVAEHVAVKDLLVTPSKLMPRLAADVVVTSIVPPDADTPPNTVRVCCRVFGPGLGTDEDPVTGSSWAMLTGYYLDGPGTPILKGYLPEGTDVSKVTLDAFQVSQRGGRMTCRLQNGRAKLVGRAWRTAYGELERF